LVKKQDEIRIFTENIKMLREIHGLSKARMAQRLGIGTASLTQLERGTLPRKLSVQILFRIREVFGVQPKEMFSPSLKEDIHIEQETETLS